ncbi:hypothetical protein CU097_003554 [Rhizopus azygosporus]|uniref:Methyltransferase domain-containing protein n=2 Tax=Rhizopus TaxID=4842 RepID=A0A367KEY2_RHIAZ|nr:hypothetical protein CU097_003554 [Rhizopus azygosporus]
MGSCLSILYKTKSINRRKIKDRNILSNTMAGHQDQTLVANNLTNLNTKREFHNKKQTTYWLPKDDEEQRRLTGQHFAIKNLYEGNVLPSITEALDFEKGINILDAGCGSAAWIMDMVQEYPNCTYHGCDIDDNTYKNIDVKQFIFSIGDITQRLPYEDSTFDFVHMRFFIAALREEDEWPAAINEAIRVTKPGGMIQMTEFNLQLPADPSNLFYKTMSACIDLSKSKGQNPHIGAELEKMLSRYSNIKIVQSDSRSCDMSSGTLTAKMFIWDCLEGIKGVQPVIGPKLGINTMDELDDFIVKYKHDLETKESTFYLNSVAVQKL